MLLRTDPIRPVLEKHGISAEAVAAALGKQPHSPLTNGSGLLNLDHLDSYVRSGRAAGGLDTDPAVMLGRLDIRDAPVSADREAAGAFVDLICAEARLHTSWDNVGPASVVRRPACQLAAPELAAELAGLRALPPHSGSGGADWRPHLVGAATAASRRCVTNRANVVGGRTSLGSPCRWRWVTLRSCPLCPCRCPGLGVSVMGPPAAEVVA